MTNVYSSKGIKSTYRSHGRRIKALETDIQIFTPLAQPEIEQILNFQFQGTQFAKMAGIGDARVFATTAPSSIDEETLATVVAYATFDDIGGNGTATVLSAGATVSDSFTSASFTTLSFGSVFLTPEYKIPLLDNEGRTAWYRGHFRYLNWGSSPSLAPEVTHTKQFMVGHSLELNVPGTATSDDTKTYAYYDSHANFNITGNFCMSIWLYPTDLSQIGSEQARFIIYRYIDANNYYMAFVDSSASSTLQWFVNEGGTLTKVKSGTNTLVTNTWSNICVLYRSASDAPFIWINGALTTASSTVSLTPPYTADANLYLGGLPGLPGKRYTGYMDNFVFWAGKDFSSTEALHMYTHGTRV